MLTSNNLAYLFLMTIYDNCSKSHNSVNHICTVMPLFVLNLASRSHLSKLCPFLDHLSRRLKVIYSNHSLSVVRPSFTFSFKRHLILNLSNNFQKTSQECSFAGPFSKLFKDLNSIENFGCCGIREGQNIQTAGQIPI